MHIPLALRFMGQCKYNSSLTALLLILFTGSQHVVAAGRSYAMVNQLLVPVNQWFTQA